MLTARESDPEDVLKGLGFRGPSVLDKIPDRFIAAGTVCDGVDSEQFLCSVQDECDNDMYMVSRAYFAVFFNVLFEKCLENAMKSSYNKHA